MKKVVSLCLAAVLAAGILAGCGSGGTSEENTGTASTSQTAGVSSMVFADTQSPTNLDCAVGWNGWYTSRYGITETLFNLDKEMKAKPWLAKSCEAVDDTTWKITLRDDVTFQNGKKMTAQSVIDSWNRTMKINTRLNELLFIDSMTADSETVLTVKTTKPVPAFESNLCDPIASITDVNSGTNPETNPVGTGPYMAANYDVKKQCNVKRYDGYWGGTPKLETATFNIIADPSALAMAQQSGESDVSLTIPSTSLSLFDNNSNYVVDGATGSRGQVMFINFKNEFLQDINVRKALSMCIDKESYAKGLNKGASEPANGLFPDSFDFGGKDLKGYSYDLEGAKKLLDEAGYQDTDGDGIVEKDGKPLSLRICTYSTKAELPVFSQALADAAKQIGIDIQIDIEAYDAIVDRQENGNFDLMLISFTMCPEGDPQYFCDLAFKTDGSSNYGNYSNAEVDALIDQLDQEFDQEKRVSLAKEIQQKILDDAGFIVFGHAKFTNVLKSSVSGCETNPSEYYLITAETTMSKA